MGVVYAARDEQLGIEVAVKLLAPGIAADPRSCDRLRREIRLGRRVRHRNVCLVHDLDAEDGVPFIIMERLVGKTMDTLLLRGPVEPERAVGILGQLLAGLRAVHDAGIVHRDLKPSNVMIGADGRVTIMDLGLARDMLHEPTLGDRALGTPESWAPEQLEGRAATPAADVYAIGLIAYRLFSGRSAGSAKSPGALTHVPAAYRGFVARCLRPRPEGRYANAGAAKIALEHAIALGRLRASRNVRGALLALAIAGGLSAGWRLARSHGEALAPSALVAGQTP